MTADAIMAVTWSIGKADCADYVAFDASWRLLRLVLFS
jgi:hypothetical protein